MKNLYIPIDNDQSIDVLKVDEYFKGLIICYKGDNAVGYIQCYDDIWYFTVNINQSAYEYDDNILINLINSLIRNNVCTSFKVIELV